MNDLLGILGRHGPVRRTTAGRYRTWCPACGHQGSLLVVTGNHGERPDSCVHGCLAVDVAGAVKTLTNFAAMSAAEAGPVRPAALRAAAPGTDQPTIPAYPLAKEAA